ncbi:histidine kinase [Sphingomonas sp.]|uniref:histidine kinase n=1 Tax=Sphingomonas sp. TaxID=28214 RepID=UPI0035C85EED
MWRYLLAGLALASLVGAGWLMFYGEARSDAAVRRTATPPALPSSDSPQDDAGPAALPEAPERSREQKRFDRYDKDRDATITREEYLLSRRKAFAKLDLNADGHLSFDEWSAKTAKRFADADADRSGGLTATEFATTKPKRKNRRPACACPPASARDDD